MGKRIIKNLLILVAGIILIGLLFTAMSILDCRFFHTYDKLGNVLHGGIEER